MYSENLGRAAQMSANEAFNHNRKGLHTDILFYTTETNTQPEEKQT